MAGLGFDAAIRSKINCSIAETLLLSEPRATDVSKLVLTYTEMTQCDSGEEYWSKGPPEH